ncbi:MAG: hypothetical protein IE922_14925 [Sphingomonadales bacterium]|nr:hypothetical protein [Sphingomonadales bacterium]
MVEASEIRDEETLKAWLDARPEETRQRDAAILAHRAAMRVLPYYLRALNTDWARKDELTALPILWANLTSGVARNSLTLEVKSATITAADATALVAADFSTAAARSAAFSAVADAADSAAFFSADSVDSAARSAAAFSTAAFSAFFSAIRQDARALVTGESPSATLWPAHEDDDTKGEMTALRDTLATAWAEGRDWLATHPGHDFWIRWYEAALEGRPLTGDWDSHWQMLRDIALIPLGDWDKGAEHVARLIAEIEKRYKHKADVMIRPVTLEVSVHEVQRAVVVNRLTLPPTVDAVYGQINLEIQRLQGINCWDNDEQCEQARALIRRLTAMAEAVQNLRTSVEAASTEPTEVEAAKTKSVLELYAGHLKSWPRDNAADLTDSVWRLGLSGASTGLMAMLGVPLPLAFSLAGALFGGKKLTDALKAGSDSKSVLQP